MLNQLSKKIFEAENLHNHIRIIYYRKQAELLSDSKTITESKIKAQATEEYKNFIESKRNIDFIKREYVIAKIEMGVLK